MLYRIYARNEQGLLKEPPVMTVTCDDRLTPLRHARALRQAGFEVEVCGRRNAASPCCMRSAWDVRWRDVASAK